MQSLTSHMVILKWARSLSIDKRCSRACKLQNYKKRTLPHALW